MEQIQTPQAYGQPLTKLVEWKNPPTLEDMKQDLQQAKPMHDAQVAKINRWIKNLKEGGAPPPNTPATSSRVAPKLIQKQAEWRYPSLSEPFLSSDDIFNVSPISWEDRAAAQQNQLVLNNQFNTKIDKVAFIDEYVGTAVDEGTVIVRVGWDFEEKLEDKKIEEVQYVLDPAFQETLAQVEMLKAQVPEQYALLPKDLKEALRLSKEQGQAVRPVVLGVRQGKVPRTIRNHPTVEICDNRNVVVDPTCKGDLDKAGFMGYSFESSIWELRRKGKNRYKNLDAIPVESVSILGTPDHAASEAASSNFNFSDRLRKKIVVQEDHGYWDVNGDGNVVPFVAAWVGNVLIQMELSPYPDKKLPFVLVQFRRVRRHTHGEPDGELLEDNQKVVGAVTRGMVDIMAKSANGQTGIRKDMLDTSNRRKFEKGQDYEFNANVDVRAGVHMHTYPEIPQSAQFMLQLQNMEAESMSGVKAFSSGISGQSLGEVAAGVRGALDASSKRELAILRRLANGIVQIGRKIIAMNQEFLSEEEVIRITNEEFVTVRRDDLGGSFDLKLTISTAEEDNNKAQELAFMFQTIGPTGDSGLTKMILSDIARLRKMPDLAKRIEAYQPQPDPMQVQLQQMQVELLAAQIETERSKALLNQAQAQLGGVKANTEQAKAANLQADTDTKNLNFVEQESGVTQERNKELQGEQARSQAQLKVLDHEFEREKMNNDLVKEYVKGKMKAKAT